jgi:hypothetical protein
MAILAVYTEIRRLADLMPAADDIREHAAAMRSLSSALQNQRLFGS